MLLIHLKADKKKRWLAVTAALTLLAIVASVILAAACPGGGSPESAVTGREEQTALVFLEEAGYRAEESARQRQITLPSDFNDTYERYNLLQKRAGFDLEPYKGKTAVMLTYTLSGDSPQYAVLLVREGKVIGGHLTDGEYGSENLPLTKHGTTG